MDTDESWKKGFEDGFVTASRLFMHSLETVTENPGQRGCYAKCTCGFLTQMYDSPAMAVKAFREHAVTKG